MHGRCRPTSETDEVPFGIFQVLFPLQEFGITAFNPSAVLSHQDLLGNSTHICIDTYTQLLCYLRIFSNRTLHHNLRFSYGSWLC